MQVVLGRGSQREGAFFNRAWQYYLKSSFRDLTLRYHMIRLSLIVGWREKLRLRRMDLA